MIASRHIRHSDSSHAINSLSVHADGHGKCHWYLCLQVLFIMIYLYLTPVPVRRHHIGRQGGYKKKRNKFMQQSQLVIASQSKWHWLLKLPQRTVCWVWRTLFINKAPLRCWVTWPAVTIKCEWRTVSGEYIRQMSKTSYLWKYHQSSYINYLRLCQVGRIPRSTTLLACPGTFLSNNQVSERYLYYISDKLLFKNLRSARFPFLN